MSVFHVAVSFVMFSGSPDVLRTGHEGSAAEPCRVDACSGGPTAVGRMLAPVHACWGDPGAPAGCGWQLSPGPPVEGLMQRLLGKEALKARLRSHGGGGSMLWWRPGILCSMSARCCRGCSSSPPPGASGFPWFEFGGRGPVSPVRVSPHPACMRAIPPVSGLRYMW